MSIAVCITDAEGNWGWRAQRISANDPLRTRIGNDHQYGGTAAAA
jgi:hypothetical protein